MMSKYMGEKQEREAEWFMHCEKGQKRRSKDGGKWTDAGGLLATWGHGESDWRRLTVDVCLLSGAMVTSGPMLKLRAISGLWSYCSQGLC